MPKIAGAPPVKVLSLTAARAARVEAIHAFGNREVATALSALNAVQISPVLEGLRLYAGALGAGENALVRPVAEIVEG